MRNKRLFDGAISESNGTYYQEVLIPKACGETTRFQEAVSLRRNTLPSLISPVAAMPIG